MRMPRVRFTVRSMMAMPLFFGILLYLSLTACRVYGKGSHLHTSILIGYDYPASHPDGFPSTCYNFGVRVPFWTRYWRSLLGLPWRGPGLCTNAYGKLEVCELKHPSICEHPTPNAWAPKLTRRQVELLERLSNPPNSKVRIRFGRSTLDF